MVEPYINLMGKSYEAMDFYENVFNGRDKSVTLMGDLPTYRALPEDLKGKVAFGQMTICGTTFNFSDMEFESLNENSMISLMIKYSDEDEIKQAYNKLVDGGRVMMELAPATHARQFGWVKDKFGIDWQLMCE